MHNVIERLALGAVIAALCLFHADDARTQDAAKDTSAAPPISVAPKPPSTVKSPRPAAAKKAGIAVKKRPPIVKPPPVAKAQPVPQIADDCPPATKFEHGGADGSTRYCVFVEQRTLKRCETSYFNYVKRDQDTTVDFDFRIDPQQWDFHDVWTSIFQVHSKPDAGEIWRCPISALEVQGRTLRMFDRYDLSPVSTTANGTCADPGNSIKDRTVFENAPFKIGEWNHFTLHMRLSLGADGFYAPALNGTELGRLTGPNTYNDQHMPFLKIGIYKPSPWANAKKLCVDYRNFSIKTGTN